MEVSKRPPRVRRVSVHMAEAASQRLSSPMTSRSSTLGMLLLLSHFAGWARCESCEPHNVHDVADATGSQARQAGCRQAGPGGRTPLPTPGLTTIHPLHMSVSQSVSQLRGPLPVGHAPTTHVQTNKPGHAPGGRGKIRNRNRVTAMLVHPPCAFSWLRLGGGYMSYYCTCHARRGLQRQRAGAPLNYVHTRAILRVPRGGRRGSTP